MSAGNVTSITEGAARRARKSVSFYDKMEEARARREEVLSRRPANISSAAPQAPGRTKPAERPLSRVEQSAPDALPIEAPAEETPAAVPEAVAAGQTVKWTIRALSLTLVILIGIALFRTEAQPPAVPPEFSPPQVSLTSQAFGPPLLASISHRTDRAIRSVERVTLAAAAPGSAPALNAAAPAPRGPVLMPSVEAPAAPDANPGALLVLPNDARPPERPQSGTPAAD